MTLQRIDPKAFDSFHYLGFDIDKSSQAQSWVVSFRYEIRSSSQSIPFVETFAFPLAKSLPSAPQQNGFDAIVAHLGVVVGLSYYKTCAPNRYVIEFGEWSHESIKAHSEILSNGLGEFAFVNELDGLLRPVFEYKVAASLYPEALEMGSDAKENVFVPVGGGKDSCVSIEALRLAGIDSTLITINRYPVTGRVILDSGLGDVNVVRKLDPKVLSKTKLEGALNGHIPVTAIVSLAACACAVLHGATSVHLSNERSANEGNVDFHGTTINHQWSKGRDAEELLTQIVNECVSGFDYFSLLRPLSELSIAQRFAKTCSRYFESFSSCNSAYKLDANNRVERWCQVCPKCQFVYLALATVLPKDQLVEIFGVEVFSFSEFEGFLSLLGLGDQKPFECVGESLECRVALKIVLETQEWQGNECVLKLAGRVREANLWPTQIEVDSVFSMDEQSNIPSRFKHVISNVG